MSAVLFDLDDTLLDHRGAARDALSSWAAGEGAVGSADELERRWQELEAEHYRRFQRGELTKEEQRCARVRAFLEPGTFTDDEADAAFGGYWAAYAASWRRFPDALWAVRRAQAASLVVGILTNGDAADQRRKVEEAGLGALGIEVFASSELPAAKPDPRAFAVSCARLGVEPAATLMVGDSWESDIVGALGVGMTAVLVDRYSRRLEARCPRIATLDDLRFEEGHAPSTRF